MFEIMVAALILSMTAAVAVAITFGMIRVEISVNNTKATRAEIPRKASRQDSQAQIRQRVQPVAKPLEEAVASAQATRYGAEPSALEGIATEDCQTSQYNVQVFL